MNIKYSNTSQKEIKAILEYLDKWKCFFKIEIQYFIDAWSISLTELTLYPRYIVIAKLEGQDFFEIKSFEVSLNEAYEQVEKEIFSIDQISTLEDLFREIKEIIYGKDLFNDVKMCINRIKSK
ncbi:MAG: hypothetical protein GF311_16125 [Candidatus Lokiarchaeota archaeon]|jgi:hypothetical protein|nr:hypothetical protein [Candidatus Lokiarchaeota archaeon]